MNPISPVRFHFHLVAALAAMLWSLSSLAGATAAESTRESPREFDIAAGVAPGTLKQFSAQAGGHLLYSSEVVEGVKTNRVKGRLSPRDALERLVAGSGLAVAVDGGTGALSLVRATAGSETGTSPRASASPTEPENAAFGTVQGRVLKVETGDYVERARVTVEGTRLESFTDNAGFYRMDRVPAGRMQVNFLIAGYGVKTEVVDVVAGTIVQRDVQISSGREDSPIVLEKFTVGTSREMEASVIALNERRFAPNLLNVLSTDEFGAIPDGSVGEFLKFVPGINIDYTGGVANTISIDGVPPSNVPVTFAGFNLASTASGDPSVRQNELLQVSINNISRVEVVLSPTPESPGSALAGSVNFVPRSAFERVRPQFNFNTYVMMRDDERSLSKTPGPRRESTLKLQPGFDLSYLYPVNDRFGFTVSAGYSNQYTSELFTCGHKQTDHRTLERTDARFQTHGYVSEVGGATEGKPYCFSYGTGKTRLETNRWYMVAFTFDQKEIRVYLDGKLDENGPYNPFLWDKPIFDGGTDGSDFTVAQRALPKWPGYPTVEAPTHNEGFSGALGGLAVYDRALTAKEMEALYRSTLGKRQQ